MGKGGDDRPPDTEGNLTISPIAQNRQESPISGQGNFDSNGNSLDSFLPFLINCTHLSSCVKVEENFLGSDGTHRRSHSFNLCELVWRWHPRCRAIARKVPQNSLKLLKTHPNPLKCGLNHTALDFFELRSLG